MTFAIAGVSGNTGRIAAETLLAKGEKVRVIVRDSAKGKEWAARGAEVAVADLTDVPALTRAFRDVEGAYVLLPPAPSAPDYRAHQDQTSRAIAAAVAESGVPHVVLLSSVGAQHERGTGPIAGLHLTEKLLREKTVLSSIRAGYFLENTAAVLGAAKGGTLPSFYPAELAFPMISTHDIGRTAAELLIERPKASQIVELGTLRSHADLAQTIGKIVGIAVKVEEAPVEAVSPAFQSFGFSKNLADLYQEMTKAIRDGIVKFEGTHRRAEAQEPTETTLKALLSS